MAWVEESGMLFFAAVVAAAVGCGGAGPISLSDLPARALDVVCGADLECGTFPDEASCRAALQVHLGQIQADVAAGKIKYDAAQAGACLDGLSVSCRLSAQRNGQSSACANTFIGTVDTGGPCLVSEDCISARCTYMNCAAASCCVGTCEAAPPTSVPVGSACMSTSQCVAGAFCDFSATASVCAALRAAGQPCTFSDQCVPGTACLPTSSAAGAARACVKPPGRGEACTGPSTCDARADFCDPATMKCVARIAPGGACDPMAVGCVLYAFCDAPSLKCVARGGVGAACAPTPAANTCQSSLQCSNGTCVVQPAEVVCPQP